MSSVRTDARPEAAAAPIESPAPAADRALVELTGVTKRYGRLVALRQVDLSVAPGEFVFLIGPSEAGKTTLLKLIHGDIRANKGTIRVDEFSLHRRWRRFLHRLRREVAVVFQDHRLLTDMTARGNVVFALQVADLGMPNAVVRALAQERLEEVGLGRRGASYPRELSGGQQRRLAIARAMGHDPLLLLADEPTANLDRRNAERVLELLEWHCRAGTTVIVATHDVDLALARPHRVVELREGRILSDRPARAWLSANGTAARLVAQHHQARIGVGGRLGPRVSRLAQLVLGYTPPPPPLRPAPRRPRLALGTMAARVARLALGYIPVPTPAPRVETNGAWKPPKEVAERAGPGRNGSVPAHRILVAEQPAPETRGAWRPPSVAAAAAATPPATINGSVAAGAHRPGASNGTSNGTTNGTSNGQTSGSAPDTAHGRRPRLRRAAGAVIGPVLRRLPLPRKRPRLRLRAGVGRVARFVLGYTPPPAPERPARPERPKGAWRLRRRPWTRPINLLRLAVGGAVVSWLRNLGTSAPALGSITLLLLLGGVLSVSGFALHSLFNSQEAEASVLHVYLSDSASDQEVAQARQQLAATAHVRSVRYLSKDQAYAQARQRPGLGQLASMSDVNPFPASLEVDVDQPGNVGAVARSAASEPGVDTRQATSYDASTYQRLRQFTVIAASIVGGFGLLLLAITYVISSNSIRSAVLARRDELLTMQLVGATPWLIRARLGVEGAMTGGLAGLIAASAVVGVCALAFYAARHLFVQILPGVTMVEGGEVTAGVVASGICLGAVAALFAYRRVRT